MYSLLHIHSVHVRDHCLNLKMEAYERMREYLDVSKVDGDVAMFFEANERDKPVTQVFRSLVRYYDVMATM